MQTEISKMSDEELVKELELQNIDYAMEYDKEEMANIEKNCNKIKAELLKRLSKNNIKEFKGKLLKEIEKYAIYNNKHLKDLIKNTK